MKKGVQVIIIKTNPERHGQVICDVIAGAWRKKF